MDKLGIIDRNRTAFIMVDVQDRLLSAMQGSGALISNVNKLLESAKILGIPLIVTEQYPKGLGGTSAGIALPQDAIPIEKISFSCFGSEDFRERLHHLKRDTIVIFGTEAHICVLKTALDALKEGQEVHVVSDAVSSRKSEDWRLGVERMRQSGAFIATTEMVIFQLIEKAGSEEFKAISKLLK
jgi:nicotinamidase-related amidase